MMITLSRPSTPSISLSSCGTMVFSTSEETPDPRVRNSESISSKKTITGMPSLALSRARWKTSRMCRSVSPTYLFSSSGPLMLRKKLRPSSPVRLGDLLGQRVGDRLGDQRLAAAGRAVEQDALRRLQLVLGEQLLVQERQLDGVPDGLDLGAETADHRVVDVRHLLEHQLLDVQLGDPLVREVHPPVDQQRVAGAQVGRWQPVQPSRTTLSSSP